MIFVEGKNANAGRILVSKIKSKDAAYFESLDFYTQCMACMVFQLGSELITNILNVKWKQAQKLVQVDALDMSL